MQTTVRPAAFSFSIAGTRRIHPDVAGVVALLVLSLFVTRNMWLGGTVVGTDTSGFFHPMYSFMGERLRALDIPGWNPHQFSGAPFAADPESGWMYLPAMLFFTALPLALAVKAFAVFPFILAGLTTYAFARVLGINALGGLVAAVAYIGSGFFVAMTPSVPIFVQIPAWLPLSLLGFELAVRARTWLTRAAWCGVAGVALSQIFGAWLGQGAYYALLVFGSYVAYRTLLAPPASWARPRARLAALVLLGGAALAFGSGLAAAGVLPRLEYVANSNLGDGYGASHAELGGWSLETIPNALLGRFSGMYYMGAVVVALALYAPRLARRAHAVPYFLALSVGVLVLSLAQTTPLHTGLYAMLPRFEELHRHLPDRIMLVFYLGPALLAGAAISAMRRARAVSVLFALLLIADLLTAAPFQLIEGGTQVDPARFYAQPGAATFLQDQERDGGQPSRYFGYNPVLVDTTEGSTFVYVFRWPDPAVSKLVVTNRATLYGLQDIQGYNPLQPARYSAFVTALNGYPQDYHGTNVFAAGLDSPLLDLLGARYAVVPTSVPPGRPDLLHLSQQWPTVFQDETVRMLENPEALPRAWLVHEARQVEAGQALPLLTSGAVDPRQVALLEDTPPVLGQPADATDDDVAITRYEADWIAVQTRSDAGSMLVLSESYDPNWRAYVDGARTELYAADHALRAVAVPAGQHMVELRYEPTTLRTGLMLSGGTLAVLGAVWSVAGLAWVRRRFHQRLG